MRFVAFIHTDADGGFGISFPDLPGCVSDGQTVEAALARGEVALAFHVAGMRDDGLTLPPARSVDAVLADPGLAGWRDGAQIAHVALIVDRGSPRRVNISMDPGLLDAIDEEATRRGMTRSAFLSSAARTEIMGRTDGCDRSSLRRLFAQCEDSSHAPLPDPGGCPISGM